MQTWDFSTLKARQRQERSNYSANFGLRIHRALSWLGRAEQAHAPPQSDSDITFISLWIAFNAAYANDTNQSSSEYNSEKDRYHYFFDKLCDIDTQHQIYNLVWAEFSASIRLLLDNIYIFQPFWDSHNQQPNNGIQANNWQQQFQQAKTDIHKALASKDTSSILCIIFQRLYTLRNQLVHGGSTWNSEANREQLTDACRFMLKLLPAILALMMEHPQRFEGKPYYPYVQQLYLPITGATVCKNLSIPASLASVQATEVADY